MTFEQDPVLFWSLVALVGGIGGYLGHQLRSFVRTRWNRSRSI